MFKQLLNFHAHILASAQNPLQYENIVTYKIHMILILIVLYVANLEFTYYTPFTVG